MIFMSIKIKYDVVELVTGATYEINASTVGELKDDLNAIIVDLPDDDRLKISEIALKGGKLSYILEEGISK